MAVKAIALLSGGLDSTLAVKLMLDQGVEVTALNFITPFCNCTAKSSSCKHEAVRVAKEFGIKVRVINQGMDYLKMVQNPRHGYGRGLNPCIDCRIFMHKAAKAAMEEDGASFIVTGEVLGQRPMSQRRHSIELIERESGTKGLIVRPLSAQHFEPTFAELEGLLDREKLLALEGRSRKGQIQLAGELGVKDYPCPAGGCLLTVPDFAAKLKDLFDEKPDYSINDVRLLRTGRHFRLRPGLKVILGRDFAENETLSRRKSEGETLFTGKDFNGPTALTREPTSKEDELRIGALILHFSRLGSGVILASDALGEREFFVSGTMGETELRAIRIGGEGSVEARCEA
jgi:hypothetical protein